jgi:hypothetical protein
MKKPAPFRIEWDAHEYEHKQRSQDWFWAVGIVSIAIAAAAVIFGNVIFGIFVLTAVFALALFINREPENVHVIVDERGITKDRIHYPYSTLRSFWIDLDHPHNKILVSSEKIFMPLIIVPLGSDVNVEELHEALSRSLPEKYHSMPFVEQAIEYLGF